MFYYYATTHEKTINFLYVVKSSITIDKKSKTDY